MSGPTPDPPAPRLLYDFDSALSYHLLRTSAAYQRALDAWLAAHGITYRQFQVLVWIRHAGGAISQADLARRMGVGTPALVDVLDRLEAAGWVVRGSDAGDRRKKSVRAGPAAEAAWAAMVEALLEVRARATARLGPGQFGELMGLLRTVAETLGGPEAD
jgi:DNA-binding MarR family transcriptional regulator